MGGRGSAGGTKVASGVEGAIRAVAEKLANRTTGWIDLARLRAGLGDRYSRAEVDAALDRMVEQPGVRLMAELVTRSVTPEREAAAVNIGGEPRHLLHLNSGLPRRRR